MSHPTMADARKHSLHAQCAVLAGYPLAALAQIARTRAALAELPAAFAEPCSGGHDKLREAEAALHTGDLRAAAKALDSLRRLMNAVDANEAPPSGTRSSSKRIRP